MLQTLTETQVNLSKMVEFIVDAVYTQGLWGDFQRISEEIQCKSEAPQQAHDMQGIEMLSITRTMITTWSSNSNINNNARWSNNNATDQPHPKGG